MPSNITWATSGPSRFYTVRMYERCLCKPADELLEVQVFMPIRPKKLGYSSTNGSKETQLPWLATACTPHLTTITRITSKARRTAVGHCCVE